MTALAGIVDFSAAPDLSRRCATMLAAQAIYGTADPEIWSADCVAIGRLAHCVIDGGGTADKDRTPFTLVADARLDNRDDLVAALGVPSQLAEILSDSAIVARAIARWGDGAIARLIGEFALAWWDTGEQRLKLARDFLGQRPLHLYRGNRFVAFASMAKGLHALPGVARAPDPSAVARALAVLPVAGSESFFAGIERVEPGHIISIDRDGIRARRFWGPAAVRPIASVADARDRFRATFDEAVRARLRDTGGRVASHLSGGLDSSAVATTAARLLAPTDGMVTGFTAVPRGQADPNASVGIADEGDLAAATAGLHANIEHVRIPTGDESPLAALDRNVWLYERPVPNLCNQPWIDAINAGAAERGLTVVLTGIMGNLTFSHSGANALPSLFARREWRRLARLARDFHRHGRSWQSVARETMGLSFQFRFWRPNILRSDPLLQPPALAPLAAELAQAYRPSADATGARMEALSRVDLGNFGKGALAAHGVDMRDPTADRRVVELTLAMPEEMFIVGGLPRSFARDVLTDRVPSVVTHERRRGYQAADWATALTARRDETTATLREMARNPAVAAVVDVARLVSLAERWPERWPDPTVAWEYRMRLLPAISAAHFLHAASVAEVPS